MKLTKKTTTKAEYLKTKKDLQEYTDMKVGLTLRVEAAMILIANCEQVIEDYEFGDANVAD